MVGVLALDKPGSSPEKVKYAKQKRTLLFTFPFPHDVYAVWLVSEAVGVTAVSGSEVDGHHHEVGVLRSVVDVHGPLGSGHAVAFAGDQVVRVILI